MTKRRKTTRSTFGCIRKLPGRRGYYFSYRGEGHEILRKAGETKRVAEDKRAALQKLVRIDGVPVKRAIGRVWGEAAVPITTRTTFTQLCALFIADKARERDRKPRTLRKLEERVRALQKAPWAHQPAEKLDRHAVRAWVHDRKRRGISDATLMNDLSQASAVLKHAQDAGWIDEDADNPFLRCRLKRVRKLRRVGLDLDELKVFLAKVEELSEPEAYDLVLAGAMTGWRLGELAALKWAQVDLSYTLKGRQVARLACLAENEKMARPKVAFAFGPLRARLEALRAGPVRPHPTALVFRQPCGSSWADPRAINRRLKPAAEAISDKDIPAWKLRGDDAHKPFRFHGLRHSANSVLLSLGQPPHLVAALLGHQLPGMTFGTYLTTAEPDVAAVCETLAGALFGRAEAAKAARS